MLILYLLLVVAGLVISVLLIRRRSWFVLAGLTGTLLAAFSAIAGFSIGPYVAPVALVVLLLACVGLRESA